MKLLQLINYRVPVYGGKKWPRYLVQRCFGIPMWYIVVTLVGVVHIVTVEYHSVSVLDHVHIGVLLLVWIAYTMSLVIRSVWGLATIQQQVRVFDCIACESCCNDMRDVEDGIDCPQCGAEWDRERAVARWTAYCDWAGRFSCEDHSA